MIPGRATPEGSARYTARFSMPRFYRTASGLSVSSLGLGTYLGGLDQRFDDGYTASVAAAVCGGINFLDSAINYRHQRSERSIGAALSRLFASGEFQRDEIVVCTKAGFLTPGAVDPETLRDGDVVGGMHSMAPDFLSDQIDRSRANLGLATLDVFYLHNPESQLGQVPRDLFDERVRSAFTRLERIADEGRIGLYGMATWDGFRKAPGGLGLERILEIAREAGGPEHRFRFIQLPYNLAMTEAYSQRPSVLETAREGGVTVIASASLLQAKLAVELPAPLARQLPGLETDAQRAIQFVRSTPGITVALVGMSSPEHVRENLGVSRIPALDPGAYERIFETR
ncbi:MAG TPA: aldo/keto reductase [Bryobacteraceae bacterium]|jgi:aryl-alcohol dehydrogenase-like predicted oxidoreductase|nr:aldo/keto reductase [Bryobacteraceae bacterium]